MSVRKEKIMALAGENFANKTDKELQLLFSDVLNNGMHGIGFSPYLENQKPGEQITEEQYRIIVHSLIKVNGFFSYICIPNQHELGIPEIGPEYREGKHELTEIMQMFT